MSEIVKTIQEKVGEIIDPETGMTLGEMELIKKVEEKEPGIINVEFIPTSPFCPIAFKFAMDIKKTVLDVKGVKKVTVYCRGHAMEEQINQMVNKE
ncbi:MAG: hypothetical protein QG670_857 [Thermoproteota archaeon]|nr:hypothetical protein [Thermoproteota archaeon]